MKLSHLYILGAVCAFLGGSFASCDDGIEEGTKLFPEAVQNNKIAAYLDNHCFYPKNFVQTNVIQTMDGSKLIVDDNEVNLRVFLTDKADREYHFSLTVEAEEGEEASDVFVFENQNVIVKKGEKQSSQMLRFRLNDASEHLKKVESVHEFKLILHEMSHLPVLERLNSYVWKVNKQITNINQNGTVEGHQVMSFGDYEVLDPFSGSPTSVLNDDSDDAWGGSIVRIATDNDNINLKINLKGDKPVYAISLKGFETMGSYDLNPKKIEIWAGDDFDKMEKVGFAEQKVKPTTTDYWNIVFYTPIRAKHIKIIGRESFGDGYIFIPEMRLYE